MAPPSRAGLWGAWIAASLIAGCGTAPKAPAPERAPPLRGGGYYLDDGPPAQVSADILSTPDAVPRLEPFHSGALRPYVALGRSYTPITDDRPWVERGRASWYGRKYHGNRTATGEIYDMFAMTAAHPTMPLPSYAQVTNLRNGAAVIVRVNDRGPFIDGRVIDLSFAAAMRLGVVADGTAEVEVRRITQAEIAAGTAPGLPTVAQGGRPVPPVAVAEPTSAAAPAPAAAPMAGIATVAAPLAGTAPPAATSRAASSPIALPRSPRAEDAPAVAAAPGTAGPPAPADATGTAGPAVAAPVAAGAPVGPVPSATAGASAAVPPKSRGRLWAVQLGAFRQEENARAAQDESARLLAAAPAALPAGLRSLRVERDGEWHRVLLGWLPDRETAEELAAQLALLFGRDTTIVVR